MPTVASRAVSKPPRHDFKAALTNAKSHSTPQPQEKPSTKSKTEKHSDANCNVEAAPVDDARNAGRPTQNEQDSTENSPQSNADQSSNGLTCSTEPQQLPIDSAADDQKQPDADLPASSQSANQSAQPDTQTNDSPAQNLINAPPLAFAPAPAESTAAAPAINALAGISPTVESSTTTTPESPAPETSQVGTNANQTANPPASTADASEATASLSPDVFQLTSSDAGELTSERASEVEAFPQTVSRNSQANAAMAPPSAAAEVLPDDADQQQAAPAPAAPTADPAQASLRTFTVESRSEIAPAVARALQVDAAVQKENSATAAAPTAASISTPSTAQPAAALHFTSKTLTDLVGQSQGSQNPAGLPQADDAPATGQVVKGLAAVLNQRGGVMSMRLDPPELGELRVQMSLSRGVVSADFQASTPQAQALLERNLAMLRNTLESQGLTVDRLNVHMSPMFGQQFMRDDSNPNWNGHARQQHHDAAGGESRGRRDGQPHDAPRRLPVEEFENLLGGIGWHAA